MNSGQETLESMSQAIWYNQWTIKKFSTYLKGEILEVGFGLGSFTQTLTNYGEVTAIDINTIYLKRIKNRYKHKAKVGFGDIEAGKYFFKNKKFDSVVCISVLEHIENDKKALKNMFTLLKKSGFLILLVPAHDFLYGEIDKSIRHFRRYNETEIKNLLIEIGFKIKSFRFLNFIGGIGWWISAVLLRNKIVTEGKLRLFNIFAPFILTFEDLLKPKFGTSILVIAQK